MEGIDWVVGRARRLATREDGRFFHAHKVFGVFALVHFAYRFYLFGTHGTMMFDRSVTTVVCLGVHVLLHVTSFQFALPARRNLTHNIIFPEMRWHTTFFGMRAIACMMSTIFLPKWPIINTGIVMLTMLLADAATHAHTLKGGNATTTMRGNAFPAYVSPTCARMTNLLYSITQVGATTNMVFFGPDAMFATLLPIQVAPLLMTLAKKGIISKLGWHVGYTATLLLAYYRAFFTQDVHDMRIACWSNVMIVTFFSVGRFGFRINKYLLWALVISFGELSATKRWRWDAAIH